MMALPWLSGGNCACAELMFVRGQSRASMQALTGSRALACRMRETGWRREAGA